MRIRWVGMLALSGLLVLSCAGEESGGQTDASTADGEGANGTVQLAFELGGELRENQPVLLTIRAETLGGEIAVDLAGEVALSVGPPGSEPAQPATRAHTAAMRAHARAPLPAID